LRDGTYIIQLNDTCTGGKETMRQNQVPRSKALAADLLFTRL
jgi:hypothetical protein